MLDLANPSVRATFAALSACVLGALGLVWAEATPKVTPVEQFLDPRAHAAMLLIVSGVIGGIAWWTIGRGWQADAMRRRGASLVAAGTLLACATLATFSSGKGSDPEGPAILGIVTGLLLSIGAAAWWASLRAVVAAFVGAWLVAVVTLSFDVGWMLSGPHVEPFEPCNSAVDWCFGAGPQTPFRSGWAVVLGLWVTLWFCIPLLVAISGGAGWQAWQRRVR